VILFLTTQAETTSLGLGVMVAIGAFLIVRDWMRKHPR
jgi:hypothetical protein